MQILNAVEIGQIVDRVLDSIWAKGSFIVLWH